MLGDVSRLPCGVPGAVHFKGDPLWAAFSRFLVRSIGRRATCCDLNHEVKAKGSEETYLRKARRQAAHTARPQGRRLPQQQRWSVQHTKDNPAMSRDPKAEAEEALEGLLDLVARLIARAHLRQSASPDRHADHAGGDNAEGGDDSTQSTEAGGDPARF